MAGAAIKRFTLQKLKTFKLIVPPLDLQQSFADKIRTLEKIKSLTEKGKAFSVSVFQSLMSNHFN